MCLNDSLFAPRLEMSVTTYSSSSSPEAVKECPICLGKADHAHFGSVQSCCNGCAAFFRRSVVEHQSYKCRRDEKCITRREKGKRGCRFCRFQACLRAGMSVNAVLAKPHILSCDEFGNGSLVFLLKCRRALFVTRGKHLVDIYGGAENYINMADKIKTAMSCQLALQAENRTLLDFIRLVELEGDPNFFTSLVDEVLPLWVQCESVFATARHRGFASRQAYYLDDSFLNFNMESLITYYRQYGKFKSPDMVARSSWQMFTSIMDAARKMYDNRITENELASIQFLFLLKTAIKLHPRPEQYQKMLNQFFRSLSKHIEENYEDVPVRMAAIIMAMQDLQEIKWVQDQFLALQHLDNMLE